MATGGNAHDMWSMHATVASQRHVQIQVPFPRCICSLRLHTFLEADSHVTVVTVRHSLAQAFYSQSSRTLSKFLTHLQYC